MINESDFYARLGLSELILARSELAFTTCRISSIKL